jgi:hypothetical protein
MYKYTQPETQHKNKRQKHKNKHQRHATQTTISPKLIKKSKTKTRRPISKTKNTPMASNTIG